MDKLQNYRKRIDKIDGKMVILLRKRQEIIKKIGLLKKINKQPVQNKTREQIILGKLDTDLEREVFKTIFRESKRAQRRI
jgi:chorismate mutase